jgi:predicted outer membrane protein
MDMQGMSDLQNATGAEFNKLWVSQMLTMHQDKLSELQTAATTVKDTQLKAAITKAIPKVKMHIDMLSKADKSKWK